MTCITIIIIIIISIGISIGSILFAYLLTEMLLSVCIFTFYLRRHFLEEVFIKEIAF